MYDLKNDKFFELNGDYVGDTTHVSYVCSHVVDYVDVEPIEDQTLEYKNSMQLVRGYVYAFLISSYKLHTVLIFISYL